MKKFILGAMAFVFMIGLSSEATAQKIGGATSFIFDGSSIGFQARYEHSITESIDGAAQFTYFPENGGIWAVDIDAHYLLTSADGLNLYPIAGLNLVGASGETELGLNAGLGASFNLNDKFQLFSEFKYVLISYDSFVLSAGIAYPF